MADMSAFGAVVTSLRFAGDITKAMVALRDHQMIQAKVIELQGVILTAQGSALAAQADQSALLDSVRGLEKKIAELEGWESEKKKYELHRRDNGALTYILKVSPEPTEPPHELCANCYARSLKRVLQTEFWQPMRCEVLCCHECGSVVYVKGHPHVDHAKLRPRGSR